MNSKPPVAHTVGVKSNHKGQQWAECQTCSWLGPLRTSWDDAQKDQDSHITETAQA